MPVLFNSFKCTFLLIFVLPTIESIPRRSNEPWSVVLCKFAEHPDYEPRSKDWIEKWIHGHDASIESYFDLVSNGLYTIKNSNVLGWQSLLSEPDELFNATELLNELDQDHFQYFDKIKELCQQIAEKDNGAQLHRQRITIVNAGSTAVYGKKYGVLLTPQLMFSSVLTHEMVHSFFIGHSYSDRKIRVFPYALSGEYDDRYDLMSTANAYMHRTNFGMAGPGLNGPHLDFLGWLPNDRMLYFGRDGRQNYTLRLSSLSVPHNKTRGWLLVMLPYDRDNSRNFYTIELRTPQNFDRGIGQPSILIHRVQRAGESYYSVLLSQARDFYELTEGTEWIKFLEADNHGRFQVIRVSVRKVYANDADISVSTTFEPNDCRLGEIMKRLDSPAVGVDHVCLEKEREPTEKDEQKQIQRRSFYTSLATYGANSCRPGFVWRLIDPYDYTCTEQFRKEAAQSELEQQEDRVLESGGCTEPFIERGAFPGDKVCVSAVEKLLVIRENAQSSNRLRHFEFFNGVDSVGA
ncbi:hypothetical protein M3Y97_00521900 [Aphelenchoides bicaudatus]|nr:hypothetical protein M3Y97_00521900 [Aphelenchoides bicaudatus]